VLGAEALDPQIGLDRARLGRTEALDEHRAGAERVPLGDRVPVVRDRAWLELEGEPRDPRERGSLDRLVDGVAAQLLAEAERLVPVAPHGVVDDDGVDAVGEGRRGHPEAVGHLGRLVGHHPAHGDSLGALGEVGPRGVRVGGHGRTVHLPRA
jgi:hypothetical protein